MMIGVALNRGSGFLFFCFYIHFILYFSGFLYILFMLFLCGNGCGGGGGELRAVGGGGGGGRPTPGGGRCNLGHLTSPSILACIKPTSKNTTK